MATVPLQSQVDELEKVLSQYRLGIAQALEKDLEKEKARLKELAENQAGQIIAGAQRESALITARAQQQADQTLAQARDQANGKVALLLAEAQQKADQILAAAEDRAKREARDRVQKELDRITKESKEEALKLVAAARQVSEETAGSIITEARKEADRLTRKNMDDARREVEASAKTTLELKVKAERDIEEIRRRAQMEADQITNEARENARKSDKKEVVGIIAEAKQKAEQIINDARTRAQKEREQVIASVITESRQRAELEAAQVLTEARQKAEKLIAEARFKVRAELEKSVMLAVGAQQKLGRAIELAQSEMVLPGKNGNGRNHEAEAKIAATTPDDEEKSYKGRLELDILPPIDFNQIAALEKLLLQVPQLKIVGKGGSSAGNWAEIEVVEPIPLLKILKRMPPVKEVVEHGSNIIVALRARQPA